MICVTCNRCGCVHVAFTREIAQSEIDRFNAHFDTMTREQQESVYGGIEYLGLPTKASITRYEHCIGCGGIYTNFRDTQDGDCPDGCTMNPILHYDEPLVLPVHVSSEDLTDDLWDRIKDAR